MIWPQTSVELRLSCHLHLPAPKVPPPALPPPPRRSGPSKAGGWLSIWVCLPKPLSGRKLLWMVGLPLGLGLRGRTQRGQGEAQVGERGCLKCDPPPFSESFSLDFVTALDVVTHSWRRDSKTQYGRGAGGEERSLPDAMGNRHPEPYRKGKFASVEIHFPYEGSGLCICLPSPEMSVVSAPRKGPPPFPTHSRAWSLTCLPHDPLNAGIWVGPAGPWTLPPSGPHFTFKDHRIRRQ